MNQSKRPPPKKNYISPLKPAEHPRRKNKKLYMPSLCMVPPPLHRRSGIFFFLSWHKWVVLQMPSDCYPLYFCWKSFIELAFEIDSSNLRFTCLDVFLVEGCKSKRACQLLLSYIMTAHPNSHKGFSVFLPYLPAKGYLPPYVFRCF